MKVHELSGIFRYVTFGLRQDWVELFFKKGFKIFSSSYFGPKQEVAFHRYLKDLELIADKHNETEFFFKIKSLQYPDSLEHKNNIWSFLWVNLCFNGPLFRWYNTFKPRQYTRNEIVNTLSKDYGKKNRGIEGACTSLISTFEKNPIGTELKIGKVTRKGRQRIIYKEGGYNINPIIILYSLYKLAENNNTYSIHLNKFKNSPLSPQKVFVLDTERIKHIIFSLFEPDYISVEFENDEIIFVLNSIKSSLDIVDLYLTK